MTTPDAPEKGWHVVRYGDGDSLVICRDEAGNQRVAFMATPGCRDQQERRKVWKRIKDEARLIAAAPELLDTLKLWVAYDQGDEDNGLDLMLAYDRALAATRAALTKAGPQ